MDQRINEWAGLPANSADIKNVGHDDLVLEYQAKTEGNFVVLFGNPETARRLTDAGPWRVQFNRTKKPYLVRSIRIPGCNPTTEYAHKFLYGHNRPRDGNYLNLREDNFRQTERRRFTKEEIKRYLALIPWKTLTRKAKDALHDRIKADDAIDATLRAVTESLECGTVSFPHDNKFRVWLSSILDYEIRKRLRPQCGDVVLDGHELRFRHRDNETTLIEYPAGKAQPAADFVNGSIPSALAPGRVDDRPARAKRPPKAPV
ncbi:MAG: hypothetical protein ACM3WP_22720 [Acidobacteriota bacterium]